LISIAVPLSELSRTGEPLNRLGVATHNMEHTETDEPSVIGWIPQRNFVFRTPDGHSLEFISLLDDPPVPDFIGPLSEWRKQPHPAKSASL
jgi:lactoylglutathione lyase